MILSEIKNSDWSLSLAKQGEVVQGVDAVRQRIDIILKTVKGSVPLNNAFGCNVLLYMDKPLNNKNIAGIKAEVLDALETWEELAIVNKIIAKVDVGSLTLDIFFKVTGTEIEDKTTVIFNT